MLQQVYNTPREQQENSKRYSKRTASLYDTVIILFYYILHNIKGHIEKIFNVCLSLFFKTRIIKTKNIPVSSLGPEVDPGQDQQPLPQDLLLAVKPEPTPDETLQKMLNTLVEWKILTPKEAELYLMIEDLPDDIPERIAQMYRDMVEKLKY